VEYEDRIRIATPEGVDLELILAGVGSRFASALVDFTIQAVLVTAVGIVLTVTGVFDSGWGYAVGTLITFAVFAGYDVSFEVLASGRTPGKRMNGLRVVRTDGTPVRFLTSAIRNLLRLVDFLPSFYLVGIGAVLATRRNQRLGDLAAGTLVVRELGAASRRTWRPATPAAAPNGPWSTWDVSGVSPDEVLAVRRFLDRRNDLTWEARMQLAGELAGALRAKVGGVPLGVESETFLEYVAAAKAARG
jgi:uncharacterized RDD family membrane protein YckC